MRIGLSEREERELIVEGVHSFLRVDSRIR